MREKGMTLLEVLLALLISTLVLGTAFWLLAGGLSASRKTSAREFAQEDLQLINKRLERELSCAYPQSPFSGTREKIQFAYTTAQGLGEVVWESSAAGIATQTRLNRAQSWRRQQLSTEWQLEFSYLDREGEWQRQWEREELPAAVKIELTGEGKKQKVTIPIEAMRVIPY